MLPEAMCAQRQHIRMGKSELLGITSSASLVPSAWMECWVRGRWLIRKPSLRLTTWGGGAVLSKVRYHCVARAGPVHQWYLGHWNV